MMENTILKAWKTVSFFNALYFADGNEGIVRDIVNEIIHQRYQPATPSFLNAGRARRGIGIMFLDPSNR